MSLRLRVFGGVALLLCLLLGAAWFLAGNQVLQPLMSELTEQRIDRAVQIAEDAEAAEDPRRRARELMKEQNVTIRRVSQRSRVALKAGRVRRVERDGRSILLLKGPQAPIIVEVYGSRQLEEQGPEGKAWLEIHFPLDLDAPRKKIGIGLGLLALVGVLLALAASRWMLRPLQLASSAMDRVASGDLAHRVAEGGDAAGRMGQSFNAMAARVQLLVEGQQELMAGVSHELRTPLARLRLHGELLRDQGVEADRVTLMEADIQEVDELVEELLEASRLREGGLALRLEPVELASWVERALGAEDLGERSVTLELQEGLWLQADPRRLHRALCNLLSNIRRYTPDGTDVGIRAGSEPGGVYLELTDHGPGVSDRALARLFEPFYREERSRSKATGGLGLGMMLVKRIVEAHGARVGARNIEGGGLQVRIEGLSLSLPSGDSNASDQVFS